MLFWGIARLALSNYASAQNSVAIDSLTARLGEATAAQEVITLHRRLAEELLSTDSAKAAQHMQQLLAMAKHAGDSLNEATAYYLRAELYRYHNVFGEVEPWYDRSMAMVQPLQDTALLIKNYTGYANWASYTNEAERAEYYYSKAESLLAHVNQPLLWLALKHGQASHLRQGGKKQEALAMAAECLSVAREHKLEYYTTQGLQTLSYMHSQIGQNQKAIAYVLENEAYLNTLPEASYLKMRMDVQTALSGSYRVARNHAEANRRAALVFAMAQQINSPFRTAIAQSRLAASYYHSGDYAKAEEMAAEAIPQLRKLRRHKGAIWCEYILGASYNKLQRYEEARPLLEATYEESREYGAESNMANTLLELGRASYGLKDYAKALHYLNKGHGLVIKHQSLEGHGDYQLLYSQVYQALNQPSEALSHLVLYNTLRDSLNSEALVRRQTMALAQERIAQVTDSISSHEQQQRLLLDAQLKSQRSRQRALALGFIGVLGLLFGIVLLYRRKQLTHLRLAVMHREIARQNEKITKQRDELEALVAEKDRFFSIISHDLRGPIHSFTSLAFLINHELERGNIKDLQVLINTLDSNSKHVAQLLDNLLQWAMAQQEGGVPFKPEVFSIQPEVAEVCSVMELQAQHKTITLKQEVPATLHIEADLNGFRTILRNLVGNALKFTHTGGVVSITGAIEGQQLHLQVKDTGIGIPPEALERLFVVDKKKVQQGTKGEKGTGLGLHLVKSFTEQNGGTLTVESTVNVGTTFHLHFPISAEVKALAAPQSQMVP